LISTHNNFYGYGNPNGTTFFFIPHISPQARMTNEDLYSIAEEMIKLKNIFQ